VIQPILPLHKCADPAPTEYAVAESPLAESTTDPALVESAVAADPAPAESSAEPLYSAAGATLTETS
jgi:hypothetical protein